MRPVPRLRSKPSDVDQQSQHNCVNEKEDGEVTLDEESPITMDLYGDVIAEDVTQSHHKTLELEEKCKRLQNQLDAVTTVCDSLKTMLSGEKQKNEILAKRFFEYVATARHQLRANTDTIEELQNRLQSSFMIECPLCRHVFDAAAFRPRSPRYIRVLPSTNTLEVHFRSYPLLVDWVLKRGLAVDSNGLPTLPEKLAEHLNYVEALKRKPTLTVTDSNLTTKKIPPTTSVLASTHCGDASSTKTSARMDEHRNSTRDPASSVVRSHARQPPDLNAGRDCSTSGRFSADRKRSQVSLPHARNDHQRQRDSTRQSSAKPPKSSRSPRRSKDRQRDERHRQKDNSGGARESSRSSSRQPQERRSNLSRLHRCHQSTKRAKTDHVASHKRSGDSYDVGSRSTAPAAVAKSSGRSDSNCRSSHATEQRVEPPGDRRAPSHDAVKRSRPDTAVTIPSSSKKRSSPKAASKPVPPVIVTSTEQTSSRSEKNHQSYLATQPSKESDTPQPSSSAQQAKEPLLPEDTSHSPGTVDPSVADILQLMSKTSVFLSPLRQRQAPPSAPVKESVDGLASENLVDPAVAAATSRTELVSSPARRRLVATTPLTTSPQQNRSNTQLCRPQSAATPQAVSPLRIRLTQPASLPAGRTHAARVSGGKLAAMMRMNQTLRLSSSDEEETEEDAALDATDTTSTTPGGSESATTPKRRRIWLTSIAKHKI